ncbi:uncharacterized protein PFL1_00419 [Pseudozyma flocculosa PF-1]|uniref:GTP-binding protein n=1 Tax=Pseudozyma flocculosa TaxID=84751 RepID=A0A5C3ESJ1_9BASI|nr:uncharacterized protein PFL1_00419 [Pseudozyma flocculosa PF-1]EPQ32222.1 hypothetical protein PFL1_00419 [Pseudozyma flocculosa PF-1]SPO34830.1 related to GTR1 - GTP-binding protein [Pseudozyma flocculosa]
MKKKVLLMGQSGCGKTSMRSLIFSSYRASDTRRLGSTLDVEHSHVRFLGNLVLNLWDCGGQQSYMDSYLDSQRSQVFSAVGVLIYVFDLVGAEGEGEQEWEKDVRYYKDCLSALHQYSPDAQVFCLLHKMDLVDPSRRRAVYASRVKELRRKSKEVALTTGAGAKSSNSAGFRINCFATSIWDETLYRAWSRIVHTLIPNVAMLERHLSQFAQINSAMEVVLFERTTFLVISRSSSVADAAAASSGGAAAPSEAGGFVYDEDEEGMEGFRDTVGRTTGGGAGLGSGFITGTSQRVQTPGMAGDRKSNGAMSDVKLNPERFEKISELIKNFKLSCSKLQSNFQGLELRGSNFTAYLDVLTSNTYIMIVVADPQIQLAAIKLNVQLGRDHFEKLQAINPGRA